MFDLSCSNYSNCYLCSLSPSTHPLSITYLEYFRCRRQESRIWYCSLSGTLFYTAYFFKISVSTKRTSIRDVHIYHTCMYRSSPAWHEVTWSITLKNDILMTKNCFDSRSTEKHIFFLPPGLLTTVLQLFIYFFRKAKDISQMNTIHPDVIPKINQSPLYNQMMNLNLQKRTDGFQRNIKRI